MNFSSNKIKLSFGRAKYQTNGNEVKCFLPYTVNVPYAFSTPQDKSILGMDTIFEFGNHQAVGRAVCNGEDVFDKKLGRDIAAARAEAKAYEQTRTMVNKYVKEMAKTYYDMSLEFDERVDYIKQHDAEYVNELSK